MSLIFSENEVVNSRYIIEEYIAAGGMQEVYCAFDKTLRKRIALKSPKNKHAEKRFKRSATLSAKVNHPNVAKTLDYLEIGDRAFLIEELISGQSLDKVLKNTMWYFDHYLLAQFGHHVAKGVAAAHHAKVIHRDLKPGNIMMGLNDDKSYFFKITDFGIAKLAEDEFEEAYKDEESITGSQTMLGAIPYMAPEMLNGPTNATSSSDIWAVGAMLYKLMTGEYPFGSGLSAVPKIYKAQLPTTPITSFRNNAQFKSLTSKIWDIIKKCMQKDQALRPTADELSSEFSELCYGVFPRYEGYIKNYGQFTGDWGFITEMDSFTDTFFHKESCYGELDPMLENGKVQFSKHQGGGSDRAFPVLPIKETD
ncbi:serine/threonine-protein kinase [Desulfobacula phenolica]|uniref:non-specific serine/threonine protein kinase n=1 Tax=Desulfobacula phenolica TaxID=90732 RepID=A0A1H2ICZ8_9BACT|nr:serine/threonine-protein kinase [Desulfobacula phenolica]SDU42050.1 serine/threonine protein kinase [Desulfobacula phenolica]